MKIAILGTRGIPNNYGGFEQFAEFLSKELVVNGHQAFVYSTSDHPFKSKEWKGVQLIHKYNPESYAGALGQFVYDLLCIIDSRKRKFDIILQLGYTSSSIWSWLLPKKSIILTNMDGLEWKRSKYSPKVQKFLKYAEKLAVKSSHYLIADSLGIQEYLQKEYHKNSVYIPYGTHVFDNPNSKILEKFELSAYTYDLLIARMEPENNIEIILSGINDSKSNCLMLVIGNYQNKYGQYLYTKFAANSRIKFLGPLYDLEVLNNLRFFSRIYFHGHSVGGTNPSLLEAMGSGAFICAHNNIFNRAILNQDAWYFNTKEEVSEMVCKGIDIELRKSIALKNSIKIKELYLWPIIIKQYEELFHSVNKSQISEK